VVVFIGSGGFGLRYSGYIGGVSRLGRSNYAPYGAVPSGRSFGQGRVVK
jgi:hypothetical protein